jgi:sulfate adenylyltransferase
MTSGQNNEDIQNLPRVNLKDRQLYDLELLMVGGFSPLTGFMNEGDYKRVVKEMRLEDGRLFPIPVVLDVPESFSHQVGDRILLCDAFGNPLSVLEVESIYAPDKQKEVGSVYGTSDDAHPGVRYVLYNMHNRYVGGTITPVALPKRHDFLHLRHTPGELKKLFKERGWDKVVGFQTRNPMHRAHFELVKRAHKKIGAPVLVHPVVGMTKPGDVDYVTRVRTYNVVKKNYGGDFMHLALLPLAMRMGGPREALWHAIIRRNYGCTHFIIGRDHAGPGKDKNGRPYYEPYAARDLALKHSHELGIEIVPSEEIAYSEKRRDYISHDELEAGEKTIDISGTEFRRMLNAGEDIPEWFSFPESINILRKSVRRDTRPGLVLFFTGLPSAGKSTIAELLIARLQEIQDRSITFLDGDVVRQHLSKGLGFSREDRDENVKRLGFVASEIAKHGGITICAQIAPYRDTRQFVRNMVLHHGVFIEIYISTSLEECEKRDPKGLYAKARKGEIKGFTGVDDPYEAPQTPEINIDTSRHTPQEAVEIIIDYLHQEKLL